MQSSSTRGQIRGATRERLPSLLVRMKVFQDPLTHQDPWLSLQLLPSQRSSAETGTPVCTVPQTGLRPTPFLEGRSDILPLMSCKAFWSQSSLPGACRPSGGFQWTLWAIDANSQGACSLPLAQVKVSLRRLLRLARFSRLRAQRCGLGTQDGCDPSSGDTFSHLKVQPLPLKPRFSATHSLCRP